MGGASLADLAFLVYRPMQCSTSILVGPARAGKTSQLLAAYRTAVAAEPPGGGLWIGPNHAAVESIRRGLIGPTLKQCLQPNCLTFAKLSQAILEATLSRLRPVDELMKRRLLADIVRRGLATGKIRHFATIANASGLIRLVAGVIRQWKRLDIWPDELAAAWKKSGLAQKDAEMLWIYEEYQRLLTSHDLYDSEGRLWLARTQLRAGNFRPFEAVRHVFVDGFTDFTRTELETLLLFAGQAETLHITLPGEGASVGASRDDLFAKPTTTLAELTRRLPGASVHQLARRTTSSAALASIEANLFRPAGTFPPATADGVTVIAAAGRRQELESLARRIKTLLSRQPTPVKPEQILVVLRSLSEHTALLDESFRRFGIPVAIEEPPRLGQFACISSLIGWLKLVAEDWPFRQLLAILSHNSLQPDWRAWQTGRAALAADYLVRALQIPQGQQELLSDIDRWAAPADDGAEDSVNPVRRQRAQLAAPLLHEIARVTNALPQAATPRQWGTALATLANEVGIHKLVASDSLEAAAWERLMAHLRSLDRLQQWTVDERGASTVQLNRSEILTLISEIASAEAGPSVRDTTGRVRVVSAATARSLSAAYVFIAGLTENSFPSLFGENALYGEAEIAHLAAAGLPLPTQADRSHDEMLRFYEILTRATQELVLSYPALDEKAQPLPPSPYLSEFLEAFRTSGIEALKQHDLSLVPKEESIFSTRDWRLRAVFDALAPDKQEAPKLLAGMFQRDARPLAMPAANMRSALRMLHSRTQRPFGPFEGLFESDAVRNVLRGSFGDDHCWSASQLEQYAYCPFQYFMARLLRIEPLADLTLETDHLERGNLLHETLARLHRRLNEDAGAPISPASLPQEEYSELALAILREAVQALSAGDPLTSALQEVDRRVLAKWLLKYYEQHQHYDQTGGKTSGRKSGGQDQPPEVTFLPAHFEVEFGSGDVRAPDDDTAQPGPNMLYSAEPLVIETAEGLIRIKGRIDRVDLGVVDGQTVFHVIDYKSSSSMKFTPETIVSGERLQLVLYALAVERQLLADRQAIPWRASYWLVCEKGVRHTGHLDFHQRAASQIEPTEAWQAVREQLPQILAGLVQGIRGGEFPVYCADENCTSRCDFRTVCRIGQIRSLKKVWHPGDPAQIEQPPEETS